MGNQKFKIVPHEVFVGKINKRKDDGRIRIMLKSDSVLNMSIINSRAYNDFETGVQMRDRDIICKHRGSQLHYELTTYPGNYYVLIRNEGEPVELEVWLYRNKLIPVTLGMFSRIYEF